MRYKSLDEKYAKSIILKLFEEKSELQITKFLDIVNSYKTIKEVVKKLEVDGLVKTEEKVMGRKTIYVSLTEKGRAVAEKLKEAEEVAMGKKEDWKERFKHMRAMVHFNTYENVIRIADYLPDGSVHYADVDVNIKGNKIYLFCEACQSFNCEHINFIWSHPKLRRDILKKAEKENLIIVEPEKAEKENGKKEE